MEQFGYVNGGFTTPRSTDPNNIGTWCDECLVHHTNSSEGQAELKKTRDLAWFLEVSRRTGASKGFGCRWGSQSLITLFAITR